MPRITKTVRHGKRGSRAYGSWVAMKSRCLSPTNSRYRDYGGRGIRVCDEWINSFMAFYECVGDPPSPLHTLDRKNTNGNYEPGNVKWSTPQEQVENRRNKIEVTFNGKTQSLAAWGEELGISYKTLAVRSWKGQSPEQILKQPRKYRRRAHVNG
jgi:hypothetical protein